MKASFLLFHKDKGLHIETLAKGIKKYHNSRSTEMSGIQGARQLSWGLAIHMFWKAWRDDTGKKESTSKANIRTEGIKNNIRNKEYKTTSSMCFVFDWNLMTKSIVFS